MGVRGLESYVREQVPDGYMLVNILEEIANFKQRHDDPNPIIIFDVMGFIHAFAGSTTEMLCGGRHIVYLGKMNRFCQRLVEHGAKLTFFCDGQLTNSRIKEWIRRKNQEYDHSMHILKEIDSGVPIAKLTMMHQRTCKKFASSLLQIAAQYGEVIISTSFDCDAAVAQYAVRNEALAVVASDSDNFIFEGKWQYWSATSLDFEDMSIGQYGRLELYNHLGLNRNELKLFATLCGNDHMKPGQFKVDFGYPNRKRFPNIRDYIIRQQVPINLTERFLSVLCKNLFRGDTASFVRMMEDSVKSYSIDFEMPQAKSKLDSYTVKNVLMSAILHNGILQYEENFIDFCAPKNNSEQSFTAVILFVIKRLAGILLHHRAMGESLPAQLFKIVIKWSDKHEYVLKSISPTYPDEKLPPLEQFIFGEKQAEIDVKWQMFIWSLSLDGIAPYTIIQLPRESLVTAIVLMFMVQQEQISTDEADILLLANYVVTNDSSHSNDIEAPQTLDGRAVRIAHQYNKITTLIEDCLFVCGLEAHITNFTFDGYYFHALMTASIRIPKSHMKKREFMNLRLYDLEALNSSTLAA